MSSEPAGRPLRRRHAVCRLGAIRDRQDHGRRAARPDRARFGAVALLHVAPGAGRGSRRGGYNFITRARFEAMIAADAFLEWADVFGNLYGTCAADTERDLRPGRDLVLVIDVQGARQVRPAVPDTVGVFVLPPSFEVLEQRLRGRSKDTEAAMQRRLATARAEVAAFVEYDYVVVNDELDACVERLRAIVLAERARLRSARGDGRTDRQPFVERTDRG